MRQLLAAGIVIGVANLVLPPQSAGAVTLPAETTYIRSDTQTTPRGADTIGVVGTIVSTGSPLPLRTLFQVSAASIAPGSTVTAVDFRTYIERLSDTTNPIHVEVYALTKPIDEATATWQQASAGNPWTTPGGDFDGTLLASFTVPNPAAAGIDDTEIPLVETPAFIAYVQSAVNAGTPISLLMKASAADETLTSRNVLFVATDDSSPTTIRPMLDVTVVPEPSTALAVLAAGGWMCRGRRRQPS